MKKFLMIAALAFSSVAMAAVNPVDTSGLSQEQLLQLAQQAEAMKKKAVDPVSVSAGVRNEAEAWGSLGANMGKAMVGAAKEVGVAANEFAGTTLGKITVGLVAYKLVGKELLSIVTGFLILVFGAAISTWLLLSRRWSEIEYQYVPVLFGAFQRRKIVKIETSADNIGYRMVGAAVCFAFSMLIGLKTMF